MEKAKSFDEACEKADAVKHRARWAKMARTCIARCTEFGLKGKTRDKYAVEFMAGAAAMCEHEGNGGAFMFTMVCIRGFSWVEEIAKLDEQDKPVPVAA